VATKDRSLEQNVAHIKGDAGTEVKLRVKKKDDGARTIGQPA